MLFLAGVVGVQQPPAMGAQQPVRPCVDANGKQVACEQKQPAPDKPAAPPANSKDTRKAFPFPEEESRHAAEHPEEEDAPSAKKPEAGAPGIDAPGAQNASPSDTKKAFPFPGEDAAPDEPAKPGAESSSSPGESSSRSADAEDEVEGPATPKGVKLKDLGSKGEITKTMSPEQRFDEDVKVADFYRKDGNYQGAYNRYKDALEQFADDPGAHLGVADMALKMKRWDEAREHYEAVLKADAEPKEKKAAQRALEDLKKRKSN